MTYNKSDLGASSSLGLSSCTLPHFPPSDSNFASISQCSACHSAGRPLSGEFLLAGGGETQQARGGSTVSKKVSYLLHFARGFHNHGGMTNEADWLVNICKGKLLFRCFCPLSGVVKSCSSSLWSSAVTIRRRSWSRAPSTLSESASLSSRWVSGCQFRPWFKTVNWWLLWLLITV